MGESEAVDDNGGHTKPVGERLRIERERQQLDVADIASRTRIPQRHLESIETSDYSSLPSPTYAMGFAKAYARVVGLDEAGIGRDLRAELDTGYERQPYHVPYDTSEPARVPTGGIAMAGLAVAILILIGVGIWYGTDWFRSEEVVPQTVPVASAPATPAPAPAPAGAATTPSADGQVVLTATGEVWVRIYNAANDTLLMKTMQPGETYDVPKDADDPMINVGRPGQIKVTIDGAEVAPLGPAERAIKDVPISAAALRSRGSTAASG
ncbi:helix-turn-helix domain-containing protein [Stakelama saccharophila]|uniref:Helix-turn-helix domain-containing protein n=1 Tax=Stakelama saccharophila TaxID=3075605 RepID=A0ABZ0BBA6_9SPHN|nr:helix-turn-helix domain-containing protein [Stakelama sp. W311]WNO53966.1 helix-turn-helix domain-containing protein [Stakelama sp. W311]